MTQAIADERIQRGREQFGEAFTNEHVDILLDRVQVVITDVEDDA
jgi:hypothetical protein